MIVDAIVLAGGRSSRLGSVSKSELRYDGQSLLQRSLTAVAGAQRTVVVGVQPVEPLPDGVLLTREDPPFGGPAAGMAAGMATLAACSPTPSDVIIVLACDMPHSALAIPLLLDAIAGNPDAGGAVAIDGDDRPQLLAAAYRTAPLTSAVAAHRAAETLSNLPVHRLVNGLTLVTVRVPTDATADVDTWEDGARLGVTLPPNAAHRSTAPHSTTQGAP